VAHWVGPAVAGLAVTWVVALIAAPALPVSIAGLLYAGGSLICPQIPERSFHLDSFQLPVCARCFGLYAGAALGSVTAQVAPISARLTAPARMRATLLAALPTIVTIVLEWGIGVAVPNIARAVAAVPLAGVAALVVAGAWPTLHYGECASRRPIGHGPTQPPANT
jgi:uncharacterized membrane protein